MNNQQNQNELNKKGVQPNPSRDIQYDQKEKAFSGEFGEQDKIEKETSEEINPSKLDNEEVDLDRGGLEFGGGAENDDQKVDEQDMSSDLGGDNSKISGQSGSDKSLSH